MIPTHLVFKWFPNWTRDRVRFLGETTLFAFVLGWGAIALGSRPSYVMAHHKPSMYYKWKLKRMLRNGKIDQASYDRHMSGLPYYQPPDNYYTSSNV